MRYILKTKPTEISKGLDMGVRGWKELKTSALGTWLEQPCVRVVPITDVGKTEKETG